MVKETLATAPAERARAARHHSGTAIQRAARRTGHGQHQPNRHRQSAAVGITNRTPQELTQSETDEIARDGSFHRARASAEQSAIRGHDGQIQVGRDRREAHQRAEDGADTPAVASSLRARRPGAFGGIAGKDICR